MAVLVKTLPQYMQAVVRNARSLRSRVSRTEVESPWFRGVNDWNLDLLPGAYWRKNVDESELLIDFKDQAPPLLFNGVGRAGIPDSSWQWYFLMQHYELPTRLLDWTESALVGLFFSLHKKGPRPCVWVLDPAQLNKSTIGEASVISPGGDFSKHWLPIESEDQTIGCKKGKPEAFEYKGKKYSNRDPIAIYAVRRNARIIAQQGTFTVHGAAAEPVNELLPGNHGPLRQIRIARSARTALLQDLELCGISESSIFPELDSLSRQIKKRFNVRP